MRQPCTPDDLKKATLYLNNFLGMKKPLIQADVIDMKAEALRFRLNGQDYDYSGQYTVVLNTPRQHNNPLLGFGSPETAKFVVLENFGGNTMPLPNPTIWKKSAGFIDVLSGGREWIYSGPYSIQK